MLTADTWGFGMSDGKAVLVTGASGFIARHIIVKLLNAGYRVRGTVRSPDREGAVTAAVRPRLKDTSSLDQRLTFAVADLSADSGWPPAMQGIEAVIHTASPFPLVQPKDEQAVIRPAVDGTLRVLRAAHAAGIVRVVMTSSSVAIAEAALPAGRTAHDEQDWTDANAATATPYTKSKTLAERAAWEFVRAEAPGMALTTINPGFVLGAPIGDDFGTSVQVIERLLRAKDPMLPDFGFPVVDVADVAEAHVRALTTPAAAGQRIITSDAFMWFTEMAELLKATWPERRIVTRRAPNALVRLLGLFDPAIRSIVPILGRRTELSNAKAQTLLGMRFTPAREAVLATAKYLIESGRVG